MELTWDDLLIQDIEPADAQLWIAPWFGMLSGKFAPVFMSKFGDWFLQRPDGSTDELSVIEGTLQTVASTPDEFIEIVNGVEWQEEHLLSLHIAQLHERGIIPAAGECYGFAPHPAISGNIDVDSVQIMPIQVWQSIAAQLLIKGEPQ